MMPSPRISPATCADQIGWSGRTCSSVAPGSPRPDVYAIYKSYAHPAPTAYECKISVSDFRADVTAAKWRSYLDFAWCVIFAAPAGLLSPAEIPPMCGLIVRHETAWRIAKKPTPCPRPIDQEALLKLLIDGVEREGPRYRAKAWDGSAFSKKFGSTAARYVADAASIHRDLENAKHQREMILERANKEASEIRARAAADMPQQWRELRLVLGLDPDADTWRVRNVIAALRQAKDGGREAAALRQVLEAMRRLVRNNEGVLEDETPFPTSV